VRRLTIIVLSWNGLAYTRIALQSLAACRVPPGWQAHLMLVDNASSDGSVEVVRRDFPEVEVLALDENKRFAGGNNAGIRRAL
jgi:GT2 family glycosyltransferase